MGEILADIRRDDSRASEVIHRLRTLLKRDPSELRPLDVNELVLETVEFLSGLALVRGVKLNGTVHPSPLRIDGHRIELQQVIINLFVNAMDAMSAMPRLQRAVTICTARIDNFAEISVSDSGPGIPADRVADVFEPFHTAKPNGMGMGLSIARTIVEAHNGRIWADNQEGLGAVFRINLPLSRAENATALYGARKGSTG
jgi:signal transduction histidine kinase